MTTNSGPITREEMVEMFGSEAPIEAINLIWNAPDNKTLADIRRELREIAAKRGRPQSEVRSGEVQDTWFVDRRLPIMAMSGDIESDRVLKLHFRHKVTDADRKRLTEVLNAGEVALGAAQAVQVPRIAERLTDLVMMLDAPDAYNREYIAAVCRSILSSVPSAACPDLHAWRFIKGDGQWSPWIVLPDAEAVAAFKNLMGHNLERGTHQLQSFAATSPVPSASRGTGA